MKFGKEYKEVASKILGCTLASYYNWDKQERPIITLLEKYFSKEDLEEFLETGTIERMEADITQASELINKLKKYYKVGTIQELADKLGVKQNTISGWKQRNSVNAIKRKIFELDLPIDLLEDDKRDKYEELEKRISFLESIILEQNSIDDQMMADYAGVPIKTIQEWKQTKPELISTIIQSLIQKGE